jgi:nucleoside-diphosphate-sugar epimerase
VRIAILGAGRLGLGLAQILPNLARSAGVESLEMRGSTRNPARQAELRDAGIEPFLAELQDLGSLRRLFDSVDLTVSLLAPGGAKGRGGAELGLYDESFNAALDCFKSAARPKARWIFASSTAVYDLEIETGPRLIDESSPASYETSRARQQLAGEDRVREALGPAAQIIRLAGLYSSERGPFRVLDSRLAAAEVLSGDGGLSLNLIHEHDAALLLAEMVLNPELHLVLAADEGANSRAALYSQYATSRQYPAPRFEKGVSPLHGKLIRPSHRPRPLLFPTLASALSSRAA